MEITQLKVEVVFGDIRGKDSVSPEEITKLKSSFSQTNMNINFCMKNFF